MAGNASNPESDSRGAAWFRTTHWSVVLAAKATDPSQAAEALEKLCCTYWYPLYAYVRREGHQPEDAQDLTQEFFLHFLERNAVGNVRPTAGKFRSFLLACLKNFLANVQIAEAVREAADRVTGSVGGQAPIALDALEAEERYRLEPADQLTPEKLFERRWAFALLERTMAELRREYSSGDKLRLFEDLQGFLPNGQETISRTDLAAKRSVSVGAIDVAVHRLRQRFGALLREQVAQTVSSEAEVEEEIRHLISVLGA